MRYLSVCSGIEAASCAWQPMGWRAVAFSEVETFARAVLAHHYPSTPNWGDMTRFNEWPNESIDLLCGGTPCQSFSVAGLREGLSDPRGNLALTYLAIAARYRPRWLVWENVPGVLSSNGGRDFGAFLGSLAKLGYGFAYRILDAQYWGVAQRRRRVFVIGCAGDWQRAAEVLFERTGGIGNTAPSQSIRENATAEADGRANDGGDVIAFDCKAGGNTSFSVGSLPGTLRGAGHGGGHAAVMYRPAPDAPAVVRRLMPVEWERLMGFPDGYTAITVRGKTAADGLRYRAIGNSWAVPVAQWIGQRIALADNV